MHALRSRVRSLLIAMFALASSVPAWAAPPAPTAAGRWTGAIATPGAPLAIEVTLAAASGAWTGDVTIPAQHASNLPLEGVTVNGAAVEFAIAGVPGKPTFRGAIAADGNTIAGDFTQGGLTFPFSLRRADVAAAATASTLESAVSFIDGALAAWHVPGLAVAVVKDGQVVLAKGFGQRDTAARLPVDADTLFAIGSATKAFTTFVMGTLSDDGKLAWDEPVRKVIPWFALEDTVAAERLTPRDLVTHRSGLPRHDLVWYNNTAASRKELVQDLATLEPDADIRTRFQYNNLMFLTAGYLVEVITGQSWEEAVRGRIFTPLGMSRSNFSVADSAHDADHAEPYRFKDDAVEHIPFRPIGNMGPAGSINSTANDMARWLIVHTSGGVVDGRRVISAATLEDLHAARMPVGAPSDRPEISPADYALGWFVDTYRGHARVRHGGNIDGFSAMVTLFPTDRLGLVVLANLSATALPEIVTRQLADRLLDLPAIDWNGDALAKRSAVQAAEKEAAARKTSVRKQGTHPSHALAEYAGDYVNSGYGTLSVSLAGDHLELSYHGLGARLEHWHYDVFNAKPLGEDDSLEDLKLNFATDDRGNVASVAAPLEPAVEDIVFARRPDAWMRDPAALAALVGTYELPTQALTVALRGDTLTLSVPGQPVYDLVPDLGGLFSLKQAKVIGVRFVRDANGKATTVELLQPNGVFIAKRK